MSSPFIWWYKLILVIIDNGVAENILYLIESMIWRHDDYEANPIIKGRNKERSSPAYSQQTPFLYIF